MLDPKFVVSNLDVVKTSLKKRGKENLHPTVDRISELDGSRKQVLQAVEALKNRKNVASQEIAKKKKNKEDDSELIEEMKKVSGQIRLLDEKLSEIQAKLEACSLELPNLLDSSVPEGLGSNQNVEIRKWGKLPNFPFEAKSHYELGEKLGILDFKKAGEVTGARFVFLKGMAARLERALVQLMLDTHTSSGYEEIFPPYLVNRSSLKGTGHLPKFEEDLFKVEKFDYFLIPTAEVPITSYHCNEAMDERVLPKCYVAYSACFRSEAGSYGKDTKGLKRQHQFNKVELVKFTKPDQSVSELEKLLADAEKILQLLKLPYRLVALCGGDVGFSAAKTYDLEVWSPFAKQYIEISSVSNFTDFQARRANIRYRDSSSGKMQFVHTLNGSGLAVGRTLMAIMENCQKADGTFEIPDVLSAYVNK
ncbi:MAG: serine--tRNA ligase [Deltaproteobacteria bacterium]|nr:serine--tRNA ligase [Deltaproteobacteria bacterium]